MKKNQPDFVTKTVKVKLDVPEQEKSALRETFNQFNKAVSCVIDEGWSDEDHVNYSKKDLHEKTYREIKDSLDLTANLVQSARNRACEMIKRCVQDWSNGNRASKPEPRKFASVVYDKRTVTIKDRHCTISTVDGRKKLDYVLGDYQKEHIDDPNYEWRSATLNYRKDSDEFYLHVTIRKPTSYNGNDRVMGVDLGIKHLAVTSTGKFFSAKRFKWKKNGFFREKRSLQSKGTRSAIRTVRQMSERENRYTLDVLHQISKKIVQEAVEHGCGYIALEDLSNIRDSVKGWRNKEMRKLHSWAFYKLREFVTYKARLAGLGVITVDPKYTSQKCSKCGHVESSNRNGSNFHCDECGYRVQSDYNAAKNIGFRALTLPEGKSPSGLGNGQLALANGTLNPTSSTVDWTA